MVYLKRFAYNDTLHPQNKESVLIASKHNINDWKQKGFGQNSIFTANKIYDFISIPESEQTVENYLGTIETKINDVLNKLEKHELLNSDDYKVLARFTFSLSNRTFVKMKEFQSFIEQVRICYEDFDISENKKYTKEFFLGYEDSSKIKILETDKIVNDSKLFEDSFYFLYNRTSLPYITSDNPVVIEEMTKNEIEGILTFPIDNSLLINRKCILLPLTPSICVFYCEYLDREQITQNIISIFDENIIFKLKLMQIRNCEKFVISNINNSEIDYDKCYKELCSIDYSDKLIFRTENNKYVLKAEFVNKEIRIYDKNTFKEIIKNEKLVVIYTKNELEYLKAENIKEIIEAENSIIIPISMI